MVKSIIQKLLTVKGSEFGSSRITRSEMFMAIAQIVSFRGTCNRGDRPGCVVVKDNRVISLGHVGSPPGLEHCLDAGCLIDPEPGGCIRTQHAEANAIAWAARAGISLSDAIMYCTLQPCLPCAKMIAMSGIIEVIYLREYRDPSGIQFLVRAGVNAFRYVEPG